METTSAVAPAAPDEQPSISACGRIIGVFLAREDF
jgi:hypothetical protein